MPYVLEHCGQLHMSSYAVHLPVEGSHSGYSLWKVSGPGILTGPYRRYAIYSPHGAARHISPDRQKQKQSMKLHI